MVMKNNIKTLLFQKIDNIFIQLFKYFFVGGMAAIVDIGSFGVFAKIFSIDYRISIFLSFTAGTIVNFILANFFVFNRKDLPLLIAGIRHYISSLGGLLTNELVMLFLIEIINFNHLMIAKIISTLSAFFVNFFLIKFFAFNNKIKIICKKQSLKNSSNIREII